MKLFWWGMTDPLVIGAPTLWTLDENGTTMQCTFTSSDMVRDLLFEGYQEITYRTAYTLGLPT